MVRASASQVIDQVELPVMSLLNEHNKIYLNVVFDYAENCFTSTMYPFLRFPDDVAFLLLPLLQQYGFRIRNQILERIQAGNESFFFINQRLLLNTFTFKMFNHVHNVLTTHLFKVAMLDLSHWRRRRRLRRPAWLRWRSSTSRSPLWSQDWTSGRRGLAGTESSSWGF